VTDGKNQISRRQTNTHIPYYVASKNGGSDSRWKNIMAWKLKPSHDV
jgi:hypothetical protein